MQIFSVDLDRMIFMNDEYKRFWNETFVAYFPPFAWDDWKRQENKIRITSLSM
jgi:hypothetical protein